MPGPRNATNKIAATEAAAIHAGLPGMGPAGSEAGSEVSAARKWSSWVMPKDAAAAGTAAVKMLIHPAGLRAPAMKEMTSADRYEMSVMRRRRLRLARSLAPQKGRIATAR